MSYTIRALVAQKQALDKLVVSFKTARVVELNVPDFALVPLVQEFLEELDDKSEPFPVKIYVPEKLVARIVQISNTTPLAYIQADIFGGFGDQGAIVWDAGQVVYKQITSRIGAINGALHKLGIQKTIEQDEFDCLGLGRYRWTNDWVANQ